MTISKVLVEQEEIIKEIESILDERKRKAKKVLKFLEILKNLPENDALKRFPVYTDFGRFVEEYGCKEFILLAYSLDRSTTVDFVEDFFHSGLKTLREAGFNMVVTQLGAKGSSFLVSWVMQ